MKDASLRYVSFCLLITFVVIIVANFGIFTVLYADTFVPVSLPYAENFDTLSRLDYRRFGGDWRLQDAALIQNDATIPDVLAVIPLALSTSENFHFETQMHFLSGRKGGGLEFGLQHPDSVQSSQIVRSGVDDTGQPYLVYGYFDDSNIFVSQGTMTPFPTLNSADSLTLGVDVRGDQYDVLVDGSVVQRAIPLQYHGGRVGLTTWFSQVSFDNVKVAQLPDSPAPSATAAVTAAEPSSGDNLLDSAARWQPFSGRWNFHDGIVSQTETTDFDYGAGFDQPFNTLALTVTFHHDQGIGAGVLFNMPDSHSHNGAQMVRYFADGNLVWGAFDAAGAFSGQGNLMVAPPGTTDHTLTVTADGSTYTLTLDGAPVASGVPLVSKSGYIGLTASQSAATFTRVSVSGSPTASSPTAAPIEQGDWVTSGGTVVQQSTTAGDSFSSTGVRGDTFRVSVRIVAPNDSGGGLVFGAQSRDALAGAREVRFTNGGRTLEWGTLDAQRHFAGEGSAPLGGDAGTARTLTLQVAAQSYSITVDSTVVATSIPSPAQAGIILFAGHGGPVTFSDFQLTLSQLAG